VTLVIENSDGRVVRRYSSSDVPPSIPDPPNAPVPLYWYRPPRVLSASAGAHRFIWDLHYQPLPDAGGGAPGGGRGGLPIQAIPYDTAPAPGTPFVSPGTYRVKLTVNGKTLTQSITVRQDPRVKTPVVTMQQVYSLTTALYFGAADAHAAAVTAGSWTAPRHRSSGRLRTEKPGLRSKASRRKRPPSRARRRQQGEGDVAEVRPWRRRVQPARTRKPCGGFEASSAV
jgi:hypothetical protein